MVQTVMGLFPNADAALFAARRVKECRIEEISILSPVPLTEKIGDLLGKRKDPMKFFTFFGGLAGLFLGALFAIGTSISYPLPRGGRPIVAIPPTLLISFETLILLGVLATFAGFLIMAKLPSGIARPYHDSIGEDRFGLLISAEEERMKDIEKILREDGAEEVIYAERFG